MLGAALRTVEEGGLGQLTAGKIIKRARVSRTAFYEFFSGAEDCFLAAMRDVLAEAETLLAAAYMTEEDPRRGTRAAVGALLGYCEHNRGLARAVFVELAAGGPALLELRGGTLAAAASAIDRALGGGGDQAPAKLAARASAGAFAELLHARLLYGPDGSLRGLRGELMAVLVMPQLGRRAACEELSASPPVAGGGRAPVDAASNPFAHLGTRLTYRTVRVLIAIAELPGASNREIALHAGISDQGQISKLLRRLERLELIENHAGRRRSGGRNAWWLTELGQDVHRATRGR